MTEELEGLTLEAIDTLIESIEPRPGLIAQGSFSNQNGCCAIGSLGYDEKDEYDMCRRYVLARRIGLFTGSWRAHVISLENEIFVGTNEARKEHMLNYLAEQRAFKCCDWVPAPKERVPARRNATVDAG